MASYSQPVVEVKPFESRFVDHMEGTLGKLVSKKILTKAQTEF
jgi:hypothetical protein